MEFHSYLSYPYKESVTILVQKLIFYILHYLLIQCQRPNLHRLDIIKRQLSQDSPIMTHTSTQTEIHSFIHSFVHSFIHSGRGHKNKSWPKVKVNPSIKNQDQRLKSLHKEFIHQTIYILTFWHVMHWTPSHNEQQRKWDTYWLFI